MTRQDDNQFNYLSSEHAEMLERIESYLAGGLDAAEMGAFEAHVRNCVSCAEALASARARAERLAALFEDEAPSADFEERLIGRLRAERGPGPAVAGAPPVLKPSSKGHTFKRLRMRIERPLPRLHPAIRKAAVATAATVMIGAVGYIALSVLDRSVGAGEALGDIGRDDRTSHVSLYASPTTAPTIAKGAVAYAHGPWFANYWSERSAGLAPVPRAPSPVDLNVSVLLPSEQKPAAETGKASERGAASGGGAGGAPRGIQEPELKTKERDSRVSVPDGGMLLLGGQKVRGEIDQDIKDRLQRSYNFQPSQLEISKLGEIQRVATINAPASPKTPSVADGETAQAAQPESKGEALHKVHSLAIASDRAEAPVADGKTQERALGEKNDVLGDQTPVHAPATSPAAEQKIIRTGQLQFEVDRFDPAVDTITKIVTEEGGFVGTTDSDKLANGKVRGTVTLRVAPDRLDTVVLKLRGIGDLKSQKIVAQDITRQYTDLQSGLRAARAMEDRLLEIIKTGKGEVKDLLEAEKQLGVWREKIEQIKGEIRYDNSQVALSTLTITLEEKDIRTPAYATTSEQVTMALETPDVESEYGKVRDAILAAKGRITQSELKQFDAGQFGATIGAELPPDQADALIGRLKQLDGRIANFQRTTSVSNHSPETEAKLGEPLDAAHQKRDNVKLSLTMYNLANIAPRRTITLAIAAANVDEAYRKVLDSAGALTTRIVTSNIDRPRPDQASANLSLQSPADKADTVLATLRSMGEVVRMETTDNPDTQNVTEAKRGFQVQIISLAAVPARHTEQLQLAVTDVPGSYADLLQQLQSANARITVSQLNQQDRENISGSLEFETSRSVYGALRPALLKAGDVVSRVVGSAADTQNTLDSKIHVSVALVSAAAQPVRQTTTLGIEVNDVGRATSDWIAAAQQAGGRATGPTDVSHDREGVAIAHVEVEVPLSQAASMVEEGRRLGNIRAMQSDVDAHVSEGKLARAKLSVTFANSGASLGGSQSTAEAVREAVGLSGAALRWCMKLLVIGLCFVTPMVIVIWILWKLWRLLRGRRTTPAAAPSGI